MRQGISIGRGTCPFALNNFARYVVNNKVEQAERIRVSSEALYEFL